MAAAGGVPSLGRAHRSLLPLPSRTTQQPQIILLKEGTDTSQGKAQLISNINACYAVADVVRGRRSWVCYPAAAAAG